MQMRRRAAAARGDDGDGGGARWLPYPAEGRGIIEGKIYNWNGLEKRVWDFFDFLVRGKSSRIEIARKNQVQERSVKLKLSRRKSKSSIVFKSETLGKNSFGNPGSSLFHALSISLEIRLRQ